MTKERPILFSGPMVRAILDGRKTQTRRVVKCPKVLDAMNEVGSWDGPGDVDAWIRSRCPYGVPGDTLWVRETWGLHDTEPSDGPERAHVYYRATDGDRHDLRYQLWRPSIHMPRWACRLTLAVKAVRVERLQEIGRDGRKAEHVMAEGLVPDDWKHHIEWFHPDDCPAIQFGQLWDSINGKRHPWASNPWVWVVEFEPTSKETP